MLRKVILFVLSMKCFLYQKTGYILEHFRDRFDFTEEFFAECKKHSGHSSRYLLKDTAQRSYDFVQFNGT